jgi:hypothetical protein
MDNYTKLQIANEVCNEFNLKGKDRWDIMEFAKALTVICSPIQLRYMITPRAEAFSLGLVESRIV